MTNPSSVRENGDFTDFAILCEEEKIDVHRVIISGKSSVFYRACTSRFSVRNDPANAHGNSETHIISGGNISNLQA